MKRYRNQSHPKIQQEKVEEPKHPLLDPSNYNYKFVDDVKHGKSHPLRGSIISHPKHRGYLRSTPLPSHVSLKSRIGKVLNQGSVGACVAHSAVQALHIVLSNQEQSRGYAQSLKNLLSLGSSTNAFYGSRLFIYCNAREWDGTDLEDDVGCTNLSACLSLSKYKTCEEEYWPYVESRYDEKPPQAAYDRASQFRKFHYSIVEPNIVAIKSALASSHPVMIGIAVFPSFVNCGLDGKDGHWRGPSKYETTIGGHSILLVEYNDETSTFTFINHWGTEWGSNGYGKLPYSLFDNMDYVGDFCAIETFS